MKKKIIIIILIVISIILFVNITLSLFFYLNKPKGLDKDLLKIEINNDITKFEKYLWIYLTNNKKRKINQFSYINYFLSVYFNDDISNLKKNRHYRVLFITARSIERKLNPNEKYNHIEWDLIILQIMKWLSKNWTAEQCLNHISKNAYFDNNIFGVNNASNYYFNKKKEDLNNKEISVLLAMFTNAVYYNPVKNPEKSKKKSEEILKKIVDK